MRVGLDIDGVLCDHVAGLCEWIKHKYDISLKPDMVTEWDLNFGPSSVARELEIAYCDDAFVKSLPTLDGAQAAVTSLSSLSGVTLCAVTSRDPATQSCTRQWLDVHFASLPLVYSKTKADVSLNVLVDDYPPLIKQCVDAGVTGILLVRPWNVADIDGLVDNPGVRVAGGWSEVCSVIGALCDA